MLHLNNKKGISVAALSVAAIVIVTLASVITISLTRNYNDAKKIELGQELNMIQLSVDNYYYENGTYPISNQQLTISNLSDKVKQTQFLSEEDINGYYTFYVIDFDLIEISSLKYGNGMEDTYDLYVLSTSTGKVYYAKGVKIGNETYYTLNNELEALLTGNNKLDINSDSAILFSEAKLDDGSVSVKISVPNSYEINSIKFEDKDIELTSQNEDYYIYYVEADEVGTINVDYSYNSYSRNAKYTIVDEPTIDYSEPVYQIIIKLSTEQPTQGPISAYISCTNIPYGYVLQYKLNDGKWTSGNKITDINENGIVYARLYNSTLEQQMPEVSKNITNIDKIAPIITDVTGNVTDWTKNNVILTVNGAKDNELGLHTTETYSFDGGVTWQISNTKIFEQNTSNIIIKVKDKAGNVYTHDAIDITYIDKTAPSVAEIIGNISNWSKWDVSININSARDNESGLAEKPYSFDNGNTWQNENYKIYSENISNIIIKIKDKAGNIYTHEKIDIIYLDKTAPSIPTSISTTASLNAITVKANGSVDSQSGLAGYKYRLGANGTWSSIIDSDTAYTFDEQIKSNTEVEVYAIAVDNVGNESDVYGPISATTSTLTDKVQIKLSTEEWTQGPISAELSYNDVPSGYEIEYRYGSINWTTGIKIEEISENTTIYARLYNKILQDEIATNTKDVTKIDTIKPTISNVIGNPTSWIKDDVTLTIDGVEDNSGVLAEKPYSFDNGASWQAENSKTYTTNKSNIVIKVKDYAGNIYTHSAINITYIDRTVPTINDVTGNPTTWTKDDVTLTIIDASDEASGLHVTQTYSFDGGVSWQTSNTKTYTENTSDIIIKVKDAVGNIYTHDVINIEYIDKTAPTITSVTGNPTTWTKDDVTLTINDAKDNESGLNKIETYSFDGGVSWQTSNTKTYSSNTSNVLIKVKDAVGNVYTHDVINIAYIDHIAPSKPTGITITPNLNTLTVKASGSTDNESGVLGYKYSLDENANWDNISIVSEGSTYTFDSIKADTTLEVYAIAVDKVRNESSVYGPVSGTTSSVTNKVQIELSHNDWTPGPITATLSYDNIPTGYVIQYKIGTGNWTTGTKTPDITSNTTIQGRLYNEDLEDEISTNTKDVGIIDTKAPTITDVTGNPTNWVNSDVTLTINDASDDASGLHANETYSFDNGNSWQTSNTKTYSSNTSNIIIKVKDKAGNIYTHTAINITYIDKSVPTVVFGTNGNSSASKTASTKVTVTDDGSLNTTNLKYLWTTRSSGITASSFTGNKSGTFTNGQSLSIPSNSSGEYYLYIYCEDSAGNTYIAKSNKFTVGNILPDATITQDVNSSTYTKGKVTLTIKPYSPTVLYDNGYLLRTVRDWFGSNFPKRDYGGMTLNMTAKVHTIETADSSKTTGIGLRYTYDNDGTATRTWQQAQKFETGDVTAGWTDIGGTLVIWDNFVIDNNGLCPFIQIGIDSSIKTGYQVEYKDIQYELYDPEKVKSVTVNGTNVTITDGVGTYEVTENGTYNIVVTDIYGNTKTITKTISNIDKEAPSKPTGIAVTTGLNTVTAKASGSTDSGIGLDGYKYSLDNSNWSDLIADGQTYTFDSIKAGTTVEVYAKAVDKLGWESSVYGPVSGTTSSVTNKVQITLSEDDWTPGPITADLSYDDIPAGYVIQYKIGTGSWKTGTKTTDITSNTTVHGRLYNEDLKDEIATNTKDVGIIDIKAPTITSVTGNPTTWVNSNVTLKVNGASDDLSGLHSTETYSFDNGSTWQTGNTKTYSSNTSNIIIKVKDKAGNIYTHSTINITKIDKEIPEITSVTGNPTTWVNSDVTLKVNGADDAKSGLHSTETYSFDGGSSWQTGNTKKYTENTSNIVIKVKDAVGNIYTHSTINITYIDKEAPSKPTGITVTTGLNTVTAKASGSSDSGSGLAGYKYRLGTNGTWSSLVASGTSHTFDEQVKSNTVVAVYAKAIDKLGFESSVYGPVNGTTSTVTNKVQITLSEDDWTKGPITATLSYDSIPTGYVIQYKIGTGNWTSGTKTTGITSNTTVYGRLYNEDLEDEIASNSKDVSKIDNDPPTDPTGLTIVTRNQTSIVVKASGSSDSGCGLAGYQYSINGTNWSSTIASGTNYTITSLSANKTYTVYVRSIDDLDNISVNNYTKSASTLSTYSVTYNKNTTDTVSNLPTSQTKVEGITLTLSSKIPTRVGYTFKGWKTSSSVEYAAGDTYTSNSALTLYAIWELNAPVVTITSSNTDINLFDDVTTTFTANVGSTKEQSYQWYYNDTAIEGATNSTYSLSTSGMTNDNYKGGTYKVVVTNTSGNSEDEIVQNVNMEISDEDKLVNFAKRVNEQHILFSGVTVTQTSTIDLSSVGNWTPIGTYIGEENFYFSGTYQGNYHQIKGIYVNNIEDKRCGIFSIINNATINNLSVYGEITNSSSKSTGGIAGTMWGGTINNCHNYVKITGTTHIGGIVGDTDANTTITNCTNNINIIKSNFSSGYCGGIVGYCEGNIAGCKNYGEIAGNYIGGIVGQIRATSTVSNCSNHANIISNIQASTAYDLVNGGITAINRGIILNCYNDKVQITSQYGTDTTVTQNTKSVYVGGIAGANHNTIQKSYNLGSVSGTSYDNDTTSTVGDIVCVGGITGLNHVVDVIPTIDNCYNIGQVYAYQKNGRNSNNASGIAARTTGIISNSYNSGLILADGEKNNTTHIRNDGIASIVEGDDSSIVNCYWASEKAPSGTSAVNSSNTVETIVHSLDYMKTTYFVDDLGNDNWKIVSGENSGYPILEWQDGTEITVEFTTVSSAQALKDFAMLVNEKGQTFGGKTVTQTADIDLSTICSATLGSWKPIGDFYTDNSLIFSGTYNGNGKTISNLYINDTCIWQGLFGRNNGKVNNINLNNVNITVNGRVGGIAGYNTVNATITGCHVSGAITTTVSESRSGGIAGTNCGTVSKCSNSATMKATNSASNHTGGIVGFNGLESSTATGIVESCYNTGSITGVNYVAGIVAMNYKGSINNCYNTAAITGTKCVGGILGQEYNNSGTIINSYNIGTIKGTTYVGGVIGYVSTTSTATVSNNYYLQGIATGGINGADTTGKAEVKTAANMKTSSFVNTLGSTNWKINGSNSGYPVLSWQD